MLRHLLRVLIQLSAHVWQQLQRAGILPGLDGQEDVNEASSNQGILSAGRVWGEHTSLGMQLERKPRSVFLLISRVPWLNSLTMPQHPTTAPTAPEPAELQAAKPLAACAATAAILAAAAAAAIRTAAVAAGCKRLSLQLVDQSEVCVCKPYCPCGCFCLRQGGVGLSGALEASDGMAKNLDPVLKRRVAGLDAAAND